MLSLNRRALRLAACSLITGLTLCRKTVTVLSMNLGYQIVQFFYLLSLSLWIGGTLVFGALSAPVIFQKEPSRTQAGKIVEEILRRFDIVKWVFLVVLVLANVVRLRVWDQPSVFVGLRVLGVLGLCVAFFVSLSLSIKMRTLKGVIKNFDETPETDPNRVTFNQWHKQSVRLTLIQFVCALVALFFW